MQLQDLDAKKEFYQEVSNYVLNNQFDTAIYILTEYRRTNQNLTTQERLGTSIIIANCYLEIAKYHESLTIAISVENDPNLHRDHNLDKESYYKEAYYIKARAYTELAIKNPDNRKHIETARSHLGHALKDIINVHPHTQGKIYYTQALFSLNFDKTSELAKSYLDKTLKDFGGKYWNDKVKELQDQISSAATKNKGFSIA
ncbi:MAG: hypothetical protein J0G32_00740 [Alphaproteobacteria bacterium]|nr:hypothetical protein [Alphaproteobacteria bacterium]OJV14100.1 MAG: hypothetical protein BGO27_01265 [Alphaproteobacteria bacterium 33-17]